MTMWVTAHSGAIDVREIRLGFGRSGSEHSTLTSLFSVVGYS